MGYVAVSGGLEAITQASNLVQYFRLRGGSPPLEVGQIRDQQRLAVDRVMGEGSLYAPTMAALALKQSEGDTIEASFILRAYRATQARLYVSEPVDTQKMQIIRRISGAFQDIPGGQILGPTRDYTQRLLDFNLFGEDGATLQEILTRLGAKVPGQALPDSFPKVVELLRREGLLMAIAPPEDHVCDITRQTPPFPWPRSARLQGLARGETGAMMALAYSSIRGYGDIHPFLGELRVGYVPLAVQDPARSSPLHAGWVLVTEAEIIADFGDGERGSRPCLALGYGLCFGHNEIKAIAMGILDRTMQSTAVDKAPAEDEEFVLYHVDGIEASGFVAHWKLPHYVTFQSKLDRLRKAQEENKEAGHAQDQRSL